MLDQCKRTMVLQLKAVYTIIQRVVQEWCNIYNIYNINIYNIIHTMMLQLNAVYTIIQRVLQYEDGVCLFLSVYMVLQLYNVSVGRVCLKWS